MLFLSRILDVLSRGISVRELMKGAVQRSPASKTEYGMPDDLSSLGLGVRQSIDWRFTNAGKGVAVVAQRHYSPIFVQPGDTLSLRTRRTSQTTYGTFIAL